MKSLYLYYYSEKGYSQGLFFSIGFLASMSVLFLMGIAIFSEVLFNEGILTSLLKGNLSFSGNDRGYARVLGKLLAILLIIVFGGVITIPSSIYYKKWVANYKNIDFPEKKQILKRGKAIMETITIVVVLLAVSSAITLAMNN